MPAESHHVNQVQILLGLAEDLDIRQIFEKLRLGRILAEMSRAGPASEQALARHLTFRHFSMVLMAKISGKAATGVAENDAMDPVT